MASKGFVDFAEIKRSVSLGQVLDKYELLETLTGDGSQRKGPDPFNFATAGKSKPFAVNLDKNVWTLFGSEGQLSGNVIDFVMHKEGCTVRQAALKLSEWFDVTSAKSRDAEMGRPAKAKEEPASAPPCADAAPAQPRQIAFNPPLGFQLRGLDASHVALLPVWEQWGIPSERLEEFGAGYYAGNGKAMKGRLAAPIEREGVLIGYCGIALTDEEPQFKFPDKWVHGVDFYNLTNAVKHAEEALKTGEDPTITVYRNILQVWQSRALGEYAAISVLGGGLTADQLIWLYHKKVPQRFPVQLHLHSGDSLL